LSDRQAMVDPATPKRQAISIDITDDNGPFKQSDDTPPDCKRSRIAADDSHVPPIKKGTLSAFFKPSVQKVEEPVAAEEVRTYWIPRLGRGWYDAMEAELRRPSFQKIIPDVAAMRKTQVVFPPEEAMFRAFEITPFHKVRVVIVGQDPYHGRGQAMGLSFSVPRGIPVPPSLMNMFKEAGAWPSTHGDLTSWANQGVLLLNTVLTVIEGRPLSHRNLGWERFTDAAIRALSSGRKDIIFLLWGNEAKAKSKIIDTSRHVVLKSGHPSPLSYEKHFKGCGHFQQVNEMLKSRNEPEIWWALPQ